MYYVCTLIDPTSQNIPFHVGKGTRDGISGHRLRLRQQLQVSNFK